MVSSTKQVELILTPPPTIKEDELDGVYLVQESPASTFVQKDSQTLYQTPKHELDLFPPALLSPQLQMQLLSKRFVIFVLIAVAFSVCFNVVFLIGVTVESNILEEIGSSKKANDSVEKFNTISGYVMAFVGLALDLFYGCFFSAFVVYLHNLPWYRGDTAHQLDQSSNSNAATKAKRVGLFLFAFGIPFALRNSFSSLQAGQSTVGFDHVMTPEDLAFQDPLRYIAKANKKPNAAAQPIRTNSNQLTGKSIESTILKNALREETAPFSFDTKSECVRKLNTTTGESSSKKLKLNVQDIAATTVVYGFSPKEWNREMLPDALPFNFSDSIRFGDYINNPSTFSTQFDMRIALDMIVQGKTLFERSVTDSNRQLYDCTLSDTRDDLDLPLDNPWLLDQQQQLAEEQSQATNNSSPQSNSRRTRRLQSDTATDDADPFFEGSEGNPDLLLDDQVSWTYNISSGKRLCNGVVSSLYDLRDYQNEDNHNLDYVLGAIARGLDTSVPAIAQEDTNVTFEKYQVNDQIQMEVIRVDMQLDANLTYGQLPEGCFSNSTSPSDEGYMSQEDKDALCNPALYLYLQNRGDFCGSKNCVFLDGSKTFSLRKEVAMIPYMQNCDLNNLQYDEDYGNFFPTKCQMQNDSVFVYGLGSYITGDEFGSDLGSSTGDSTGVPYILNPRRHIRMTFARINWTTTSLDDRFNAECSTNQSDCTGLAHKLEPSGRYLFLGQKAFPSRQLNKSGFHQPIPLVRLNSRAVYVDDFQATVDLERLNPENFNTTLWDPSKNQSLKEENCSMLMDSYMNQIENNNYFLEKPLQVMYTSALLFLFQDAGITQVNDTKLLAKPELMAKGLSKDPFFNLKLNGDETVREIRVKVPLSSAITTFVGCGVILLMMILVLAFPTRRLRIIPGATMAEEYIEMHTETYSELIHEKNFKFETGEVVPTADYEPECVTLLHREDRDQAIKLY